MVATDERPHKFWACHFRYARRVLVGGELGGSKKVLVSLALVLFWIVFVVMSSLKFEDVI